MGRVWVGFTKKMKNIKKNFVLQTDSTDCGVACLLSVIRYFGGESNTEYLRELCGTSLEGTTLLGLVQGGQDLGIETKGLRGNFEYLEQIENPVILPVQIENRFNHYVVCYPSTEKDIFVIGDPAKGINNYTKEELEKIWVTKALVQLQKTDKFILKNTLQQQKRIWFLNLLQEDFGIITVSFALGLAIAGLGLTTAIFSQKLIDEILPKAQYSKLYVSLVLLCVILFARNNLNYLRTWFLLKQSIGLGQRMMSTFFGNLLYLPKSFFDHRSIGDLTARMHDTNRIRGTITFLVGNVLVDALVVLMSIIFLFFYRLEIGFLAIFSVLGYLGVIFYYQKSIISQQKQVMQSYAKNEGYYIDTLQGISVIKNTNKEHFFQNIIQNIYNHYQKQVFDLGIIGAKFNFWGELIGLFLMISAFGYGSYLVIQKKLPLGEMIAITTIVSSFIPSLVRLITAHLQIQEARVAFERMYEFASVTPENLGKDTQEHQIDNFEILEVKNLTFRFKGHKTLLKDFNLTLQKGEVLGLIGKSGMGKSTFIQILQRFYTAEKVEILYNHQNWELINLPNWRKIIGIVPQDIKIFNANVFENIALENSIENYQKIVLFCQNMGFSKYLEALPQSYFTILGEHGIKLSGGQKQLIGFLRALYQKPQILLLDEFMTGMDEDMQKEILSFLEKIKKDLGIIFISHQKDLLLKADKILNIN